MKYTCVDAFSGAGGLSLGLLQAGFDIVLSFDNDPVCVETQRLNAKCFQRPAILGRIDEMLDGGLLDRIKMPRGELFLLAGGPPCQGFSIQRIGQDEDFRNELVIKFMRLVVDTEPAYFLMENVPGISGKRGEAILCEAVRIASEAGYWVHRTTLDAQDFGVPQRRKRVFVVGERAEGKLPMFVFPAPTTPNGRRITIFQAIGHLPPTPDDGKEHPVIPNHRSDRLSETNKRRLQALQPGQGMKDLPPSLLAECHRIGPDLIGHRNVYGRMSWDDVAPTITARFDSFTRGQFGHPEQLRSISLREGALLQTFPSDFVFSGNKVDIARQIGNAVPPLLARTIAEQVVRCHLVRARAREASPSQEKHKVVVQP